jgi:hypothetical protein
MSKSEASHFTKLAAGQEITEATTAPPPGFFDLTREGTCPEEVGEIAEVFGFMTIKVEAREHALEKALAAAHLKL